MIDDSKYDLKSYGIDATNAKEVNGQNAIMTFCPKCHDQRKPEHQKQRELYVNFDNGCCHCHNCGEQWRMDSKEYQARHEKAVALAKHPSTFTRPKVVVGAKDASNYSEKMHKYLTETRGISIEVLKEMKVTEQVEYMPQTKDKQNCVVFNYYEQGFLINRKFRDGNKNFKMETGAELIPYNVDGCLGEEYIIVTEGEFDTLAFKVAGYMSVISVPSGANNNTAWLNRFWDLYFSDKKKVYIATDMDAPGMKIAEELIRRFGPECCLRVHFSEGCKDANEELLKNGVDGLKKCIDEAEQCPLRDIQTVDSFEDELDALYENGPEKGKVTGWKNLDKIVQFGSGQLALLTGRTNEGKSEFLDELVLRLGLRTGWNIGYWTPENTLMDHCKKVIEKLTDRSFAHHGTIGVQPDQYALCKQWMKDRLSWVELPFDQLHLEIILERCRSLVRKYGIRILVLDPFNYIEKENNATCSENAWDSHVVGAIKNFAIEHDVLVFLVAHPRKVEMMIDGRKRRINIEDISGTADFGNKADYCFCVDRDDEHNVVTVFVDKVRRKQYGTKGTKAYFVYKSHSGRYCPCEVDENKNPQNTDFQTDGGMWLKPHDLFGNEICD
ncbi:MAG: toprim domain-containing protein [Bacteroidaceae bacterium]|nr:toprim domain-containing protein [Bacteroidaceae bacterium]